MGLDFRNQKRLVNLIQNNNNKEPEDSFGMPISHLPKPNKNKAIVKENRVKKITRKTVKKIKPLCKKIIT